MKTNMKLAELKRHFDTWSLAIISVTVILFVAALFTKGLTHDILLEVAVFLVSIKLIVMSYKNIDAVDKITANLENIERKIDALALQKKEENS